jgi:hypothetical protein
MKLSPAYRHRRSIRLKGYDYTDSGAYSVTVCTHNRECLFGEIVDVKMQLNNFGIIASRCWEEIPTHFDNVSLDVYVVMPNHLHGIIVLKEMPVGEGSPTPMVKNGRRWEGLSPISSINPQSISTRSLLHRARRSGSEIIMSISSGMSRIGTKFVNISETTLSAGKKMKIIQQKCGQIPNPIFY